MAETSWIVGAQVSTSHTALSDLTPARVDSILKAALAHVPFDIVIVGAREAPEVFTFVADQARPHSYETYVWYNVLSDVEGTDESELVIDWEGRPSTGWGWWAEQDANAEESFRFVCPNNPSVRKKTLGRIEHLLTRYGFDGVFIDKVRFPSPANGLREVFSCFCDHCRRAAAAGGLDLEAVASVLERRQLADELGPAITSAGQGDDWPSHLFRPDSLMAGFMRFRADSVTGLVAEASALAARLGRKLAFDLFSAGMAPIVGQDYRALSRLGAWAKPMTYRDAQGPASIRLEMTSLMTGLSEFTGVPLRTLERGLARLLPDMPAGTLATIRDEGVPYTVVGNEIAAAVRQMAPVPIYTGIETVSYPGIIDIKPHMVREMVKTARAAGARGAIASWDLVYTPEENLLALRADA